MVADAGFSDHRGVPKYLWSDPSVANQQNKQQIQAALDEGGVDVFGMTGSNIAESTTPTEGYSEWIAYALQENPDVDILISVPAIDFPADWQQRAEECRRIQAVREHPEYATSPLHGRESRQATAQTG